MAFQIVDDVLDLVATDEQLGKPSGNDLREGVYTLPVIRMLADGQAASATLRDLLGEPLDDERRDRARALIVDGPEIATSVETAQSYVDPGARGPGPAGAHTGSDRPARCGVESAGHAAPDCCGRAHSERRLSGAGRGCSRSGRSGAATAMVGGIPAAGRAGSGARAPS